MAKHRRKWNEKTYLKLVSEGRGSGHGVDYKPWICIQDFASKGMVSRVLGYKSGRIHHLMSGNETAFFYISDFDQSITDIREQFPLLDVLDTVRIAESAGIRHPRDSASRYPYVMTTDFVLTTNGGLKACSIKESSALSDKRTIEKLEIERRYWKKKGVEWQLITEKDINFAKARNLEWVGRARSVPDMLPSNPALLGALSHLESLYATTRKAPVHIASEIERSFSLDAGMGMTLFQYLILTGRLDVDLEKPLDLSAVRGKRKEGSRHGAI